MRVVFRSFLLSFVVSLCCMMQTRASHIVGGDLTYMHISNDSFEITLVLYVDCFFGQPVAISQDATSMISIFNATTRGRIKSILEPRSEPVRINSVSMNCVSPPATACVDQYIYKYYTTLPFLAGGYTLAFQRCCRNNTIKNIVDPASSGTTFWCNIPDSVWSEGYNSSAVFKTLPPNYLCATLPFTYDHSALDADGDSLSYELYTPYLATDGQVPRPIPPDGPPYNPIAWSAGYGANSMMLGNPELTIDPVTGVINVTPQINGQYVVGIAVNEFRNGKKINTTRRDFQFNVFVCQVEVVSAFSKDLTACNDTIAFKNNSFGATKYLWDFGDSLLITDTSSAFEPTFIYTRTGAYKVKLIASKGNCKDSTIIKVTIDRDLGRFATDDLILCKGDSIKISTNDSVNFNYFWTPSTYLNDPRSPNPLSGAPVDISYIVRRTSDLCVNIDTVNIKVNKVTATFSPKVIEGCKQYMLKLDSVKPYPVMLWEYDKQAVSAQFLESSEFKYGAPLRLKLVVSDRLCYDTLYKESFPVSTEVIGFIPNVFTPNDDGVNDCYQIKDVFLTKECSQLVVYNRWGKMVYNSDEDGPCWNGTSRGSQLSAGTYYYILQHKGKDFHGTIALMR
jgi:gliding motility-associated-like protein